MAGNDPIPAGEGVITAGEGVVPKGDGLIPEGDGLIPEGDGLIPEVWRLVPEVRRLIPEVRRLTPRTMPGVLSGVVVDEVTTLPPGTPATATASLTGTVLHLSFGLPVGNDGGRATTAVPAK